MSRKILYCSSFIFLLLLFFITPAYSLEIKAFGDVTFGDSSKSGDVSGFALGQLDLWGTHKIDDSGKTKVFLELVVESPGSGFVVDLERLWLEHRVNENFAFRAGRFHSSVGYWNRVYHHGAHMQTPVSRPLFLDFEDGSKAVLPTHIIGGMAIADIDTSPMGIHFELQVGNGTSYNGTELDPNNVGDIDESKNVTGRIIFSPSAVEGLGIGFSFVANSARQKNAIGGYVKFIEQKIYEADVSYVENNFEMIFEHYWMANKDITDTERTSTFWYAQGGYTFFDSLTPYVRYEALIDIEGADPYFTILGITKYKQIVIGTRYDYIANSSLKLEGRFLNDTGASNGSSESYWLQLTFAF